MTRTTFRRALAPAASLAALGIAATAVLADPNETVYPRFCNANQCVLQGSTSVICFISSDRGCCCKFPGQSSWTCQCVDEVTCLTDTDCRANGE